MLLFWNKPGNGRVFLAQVIRQEQPSLIGMQEIQSTWLMSGNTDLVGFIASTFRMRRKLTTAIAFLLCGVVLGPSNDVRVGWQDRTGCRRFCKATAASCSRTIKCSTRT